jgi:hypothetical protein
LATTKCEPTHEEMATNHKKYSEEVQKIGAAAENVQFE